MNYSKGVSWITDTRIPFVDEGEIWKAKRSETNNPFHLTINKDGIDYGNTQGRFTPNLLVCDDMLNDGKIGGGGKMKKTGYRVNGKSETSVGLNGKKDAPDNYGDKGSNSRYYSLDLWFNKMIEKL